MRDGKKALTVSVNVVVAFLIVTVVLLVLGFLVNRYTDGFVFFGRNATEGVLPGILGVLSLERNG